MGFNDAPGSQRINDPEKALNMAGAEQEDRKRSREMGISKDRTESRGNLAAEGAGVRYEKLNLKNKNDEELRQIAMQVEIEQASRRIDKERIERLEQEIKGKLAA